MGGDGVISRSQMMGEGCVGAGEKMWGGRNGNLLRGGKRATLRLGGVPAFWKMMMMRFLLVGMVLGLWGCKLPEVNLATSEPLKVDIKVDLNVYQHSTPEAAAAADAAAEGLEAVQKRKYNRASEIQELKNQRFLAETHRGLLLLRNPPAGTFGEYVKKVTDEENADRMKLMTAEAAKAKRELNEVEAERYAAAVKGAHAGEWIEVPDPMKPESYKLEQKR